MTTPMSKGSLIAMNPQRIVTALCCLSRSFNAFQACVAWFMASYFIVWVHSHSLISVVFL